jgi:hypothetical protein
MLYDLLAEAEEMKGVVGELRRSYKGTTTMFRHQASLAQKVAKRLTRRHPADLVAFT